MAERKLKEKVSIDLSDAQCFEIGRQQAEKELLYPQIEEQKKQKNSEYAERLKKLRADIQELAQQQKDKKRLEEIEVLEVWDTDRNTVNIVRADDKRQIIRHRPMTLNEMAEVKQKAFTDRQKELPLGGKPKDEKTDGQKIVKVDNKKRKKTALATAPEQDSGVVEDDYSPDEFGLEPEEAVDENFEPDEVH